MDMRSLLCAGAEGVGTHAYITTHYYCMNTTTQSCNQWKVYFWPHYKLQTVIGLPILWCIFPLSFSWWVSVGVTVYLVSSVRVALNTQHAMFFFSHGSPGSSHPPFIYQEVLLLPFWFGWQMTHLYFLFIAAYMRVRSYEAHSNGKQGHHCFTLLFFLSKQSALIFGKCITTLAKRRFSRRGGGEKVFRCDMYFTWRCSDDYFRRCSVCVRTSKLWESAAAAAAAGGDLCVCSLLELMSPRASDWWLHSLSLIWE